MKKLNYQRSMIGLHIKRAFYHCTALVCLTMIGGCTREKKSEVFEEGVTLVFNNNVNELRKLYLRNPDLACLRSSFDESTLLFVACSFPNTDNTLDFLLDHGADVNALDASGSTPLHQHILSNVLRENVVKKLISHGANVAIKNKSGKTPVELLDRANRSAAKIKLLLEDKSSYGHHN